MARETTLTGKWKTLADALGGVGLLAEACAVSRSTIARWADGTQVPHRLIRDMVNELAVANACKPPFAAVKKAKVADG